MSFRFLVIRNFPKKHYLYKSVTYIKNYSYFVLKI